MPIDFESFTPARLRRTERLKWSHPQRMGAWVAEMDFGVAPEITAALLPHVTEGSLGYATPHMRSAAAQAAADWIADTSGWTVPVDSIHHVRDVLTAFMAAARAWLTPGSPVVVPTPSYMPFLTLPGELGHPVVRVPSLPDDDGVLHLDLDGIAAALAQGAGMVVLVNPANPIGRVYSRGELAALADVVESHGARVFADEIHSPLVLDPEARHVPYASVSEAAAQHSMTALSPSKGWNVPGMKCAQAIVTSDRDRELARLLRVVYGDSASTLGYVAAAAAYRDARPWLAEVREYLRGNSLFLRDLLAQHLPEAGYTLPQGTYLAWLDLRTYDTPAAHPAQRLLDGGVWTVDGVRAGAPGFARFNFAMARSALEQTVELMGQALR